MAKKQTVRKKKRVRSFIFPSHTKGYYRFSKEFPSVTDSEGYRDNDLIVNSPAKKASLKRRLIALFVCVFAVTYAVTLLCFSVSKIPVIPTQESTTGEAETKAFSGCNASYLSGEVLSYSSAESVIGDMKYLGIDTVVIDFKDASGNFYYKPSLNVANEALLMASDNAQKIVKEFRDASIKVFARFAMFADDIYARTNQSEAAYVMTAPEEGSNEQVRSVWYSGGSDSHAWLNPYSAEVQYYLRVCIQDICVMNVDGIIFDYVQMPVSAESENVMLDSAENTETPSEAMTSFVSLLNNNYVDCETAAVIPIDVMLEAIKSGDTPSAFMSGCDFAVPDARLSLMPDNTIIGNRQYAKAALSPKEFITDYINAAKKFSADGEHSVRLMPLIEAEDTDDLQLSVLAAVSGDSFIMYSSAEN